MFRKKTVFILGAGSNVEYGFFLNPGLMAYCSNEFPRNLEGYLSKDTLYNEEQKAFFLAQATNLRNKINANLHFNIDHLLSMNPNLEVIGKFAIADAILNRETDKFPIANQKLYCEFFRQMTDEIKTPSDSDKFLENRVTFITFNYDRSLERFLWESLRNFFQESVVPAGTYYELYIQAIKVYHVYGSLGSLFDNNENYLAYGAAPSFDVLTTASSRINVLYGQKGINDGFNIWKQLKEADGVFFIGFGFDEDNLINLKIPQTLKAGCRVYGTGIGIPADRLNGINSMLKGYTEAINHMSIEDVNPFELLQNRVVPFCKNRL